MIEEKDLGLKVATSKEEALWAGIRDRAEADTKQAEASIEINKAIVELARRKLKGFKKDVPAGVG